MKLTWTPLLWLALGLVLLSPAGQTCNILLNTRSVTLSEPASATNPT